MSKSEIDESIHLPICCLPKAGRPKKRGYIGARKKAVIKRKLKHLKQGIAREENGNAVSERISDVGSSKLDSEKTCFSQRRVIDDVSDQKNQEICKYSNPYDGKEEFGCRRYYKRGIQ